MAEETSALQVGASGETPQGQTGAPASSETLEFEPERAKALIAKLRDEAKAASRELATLRSAQQEAETAKLSEQERLSKRLAELERTQSETAAAHQARVLRYEVQLAAARHGIIDPDAAVRLLDLAALERDAEGQPTNLDTALTELLKARPYLKAQAAGVAVAPTNGAKSSQNGQRTYTAAQLKDYKFYSQHRADIETALREGRIVP